MNRRCRTEGQWCDMWHNYSLKLKHNLQYQNLSICFAWTIIELDQTITGLPCSYSFQPMQYPGHGRSYNHGPILGTACLLGKWAQDNLLRLEKNICFKSSHNANFVVTGGIWGHYNNLWVANYDITWFSVVLPITSIVIISFWVSVIDATAGDLPITGSTDGLFSL